MRRARRPPERAEGLVAPGPAGRDPADLPHRGRLLTDATPAPADRRWGLGDAVAGFFASIVLSTLAVSIVVDATGEDVEDLELWIAALLQIPLWIGMLAAVWWAGERKGGGVVDDFGFRFRLPDVPWGLLAGVATQLLLVPLLYLPILEVLDKSSDELGDEARELADRAHGLGVLVLVLLVVVGAPLVEELFWRGLVLRALEHRFGPARALWGSAVAFGLAHFQALELPALIAFGLVAGWLVQRAGRLGPGVFAHVAFNAFTVARLLLE